MANLLVLGRPPARPLTSSAPAARPIE